MAIGPAGAWLVLLLLVSQSIAACSVLPFGGFDSRETDTIRHLVILYTNDEHGWMEPYQNTSGAAGMARLWRQREGLGENEHLLVLSGGDMWTGPALSTVLEGESTAEVMNEIGYQAAAIGNHDFDFGQEALRARLEQSDFPFLSANIRIKETGQIPDFAQPYLVAEINGVQVGIIGLTTTETRVDTKPAHVTDLNFMEYRDVIPTFSVKAREDGAELLMIIAHVCAAQTRVLAPLAAEHGIHIIGGGHCHEEVNEVVDGVRLVESGFFMRGYIRIELLFDTEIDQIIEIDVEQISNRSSPDPQISDIMEAWRIRTEPSLWETIGYADESIGRTSPEMAAILLEPWLAAWPEAQIAMADPRYVQQDLYPGSISPSTIIGLLSTTNELVEVDITGAQIVEIMQDRQPLIAGIVEDDDSWLADDEPINLDTTYQVLVPDALYSGGYYYEFFRLDAEPTYTGIDWRQPPTDWIASLNTSRSQPLNLPLAGAP
jgi:5'-nucleotidase/UDP-sugar diphosphatase